MPTATKAKPKTKNEKEEKDELEALDEEIETLDPVALSIERKFTNPENGEEVVFIQKEMGFLTKTKFSRLLAGTLRLADEEGDKGSILSTLGENTSWLPLIFQAIELAPDFLEEAFILALRVPPNDQMWFREALDEISDDEGFDIIDAFVAQNGKALRDFFVKHGKKIQARFSQEVDLGDLISD